MTHAMTDAPGLPDPDHDHAFYDGVPAKRLFAWVVDVIIVTSITFLLGLVTLSLLWWLWPLVYIVVDFLYRAGTIAGGSATLGMRLMNLELRNGLGRRLSGGEAVLHTGLYLVLSASMILQLVSIGLMAASRRHQGLHDHILGTAAINRPR
jgi:uncharacterized RDD family membrane protein YckC